MYKIYQVEYGDTLDIIASKTGTTRDNIKNTSIIIKLFIYFIVKYFW